MSEANIILAERFFDGSTRRDLQRYLSFLDPDVEIDASRVERPYAGIYRGREQIEALFREMNRPWQAVRYATANPLALGDRVVIDVTRTTTARSGDGGVWSALTAALTVRAGKVISFKLFPRRDEALEAAGLARSDRRPAVSARRRPEASQLSLTKREREVVRLIALGRATGEIAMVLNISSETVRTHVRNAMTKLGAHTRAQLVALVLSNERAVQGGRSQA